MKFVSLNGCLEHPLKRPQSHSSCPHFLSKSWTKTGKLDQNVPRLFINIMSIVFRMPFWLRVQGQSDMF